MSNIDNCEDFIDVRDIIERVENLREEEELDRDDKEELERLENLLSALKDNGGDEEWEGAWYPVTLLREDYFTEYAQELAGDCIQSFDSSRWPFTCIDWDEAAEELKADYSSVDYDGVTYFYR